MRSGWSLLPSTRHFSLNLQVEIKTTKVDVNISLTANTHCYPGSRGLLCKQLIYQITVLAVASLPGLGRGAQKEKTSGI